MRRNSAVSKPIRRQSSSNGRQVALVRSTRQNLPIRSISVESKVFYDILDTLQNTFSKPIVIISALFVLAIVLSHQEDFDQGLIGQWAKEHANNTIAKWITKNSNKLLGSCIFFPALIDIPKQNRLLVVVAVIGWVYLIPGHTSFEYMIQSVALHTFFRVRLAASRILLVFIIGLAWFTGYLVIHTSPNKLVNADFSPSDNPSVFEDIEKLKKRSEIQSKTGTIW